MGSVLQKFNSCKAQQSSSWSDSLGQLLNWISVIIKFVLYTAHSQNLLILPVYRMLCAKFVCNFIPSWSPEVVTRVETTFRRAVVLLVLCSLFSEFVVPCDGCWMHFHWLLLSWIYLSVVIQLKTNTNRRLIELSVQNICNLWLVVNSLWCYL